MSRTLIGPFTELLPMTGLPSEGPIKDEQVLVLKDAGILVSDGEIVAVDSYTLLQDRAEQRIELDGPVVGMPGLIDCHTHICWAGSRAADFARRLNGMSYQEIAKAGGGILDTVRQTRQASREDLLTAMRPRLQRIKSLGVTTVEVKSGYGLTIDDELKMLEAIQMLQQETNATLVPTCLAAHIPAPEAESPSAYLDAMLHKLLPAVWKRGLAKRVDIFVEDGAFDPDIARPYLQGAKQLGFELTIHADQFSVGGTALAAELGALSADHLEHSSDVEISHLRGSGVTPVALPGASLGLGMAFTPARRCLDAGLSLAIASDWNPGSAPQGNLLCQAAVLAAAEKLSTAETLAGITLRAAWALGLHDRGCLAAGMRADLALFPCADHRDILYHQGELRPSQLCINGQMETL